jgi:acetyl-CoA carboxylase biotin carboxyl carrier protein
MSTLTYRDVVDVLNLLKESPHCASLDLELGDLKFSMRREAGSRASAAASPAMKPPQSAAVTQPPVPLAAKPVAGAEGTFIRAPLLGTFYRTLEPNAPPCVKVGDIVGPNDTVGLIEVMKLYTAIEAGVAGRIVEILAETGALVEYDQPLFRIEPA